MPTWDCDGQGNCFDPGTGNGIYSSLTDCQLVCFNVSITESSIANFKIYPNPSRDIFNIEFESLKDQDIIIRVINTLGEVILNNINNYNSDNSLFKIDLRGNSHGTYYIEIITEDKVIKRKLILF